jgi:hypothetical protein
MRVCPRSTTLDQCQVLSEERVGGASTSRYAPERMQCPLRGRRYERPAFSAPREHSPTGAGVKPSFSSPGRRGHGLDQRAQAAPTRSVGAHPPAGRSKPPLSQAHRITISSFLRRRPRPAATARGGAGRPAPRGQQEELRSRGASAGTSVGPTRPPSAGQGGRNKAGEADGRARRGLPDADVTA